MRTSEWIQSGFALILTAAAWLRPLPPSRRWTTTLLAAIALAVIATTRHLAPQNSVLRDWLPVPLLLIPYWQTGHILVQPFACQTQLSSAIPPRTICFLSLIS